MSYCSSHRKQMEEMSPADMGSSPEKASPAALVSCGNLDQKTYIIESNTVIIGWQKGALIKIEHPDISRCHLVIKRRGDKFTICDTSTHGTFINGRQLERHQIIDLQHMDKICLLNLLEFTYIFKTNHNLDKQGEALIDVLQQRTTSLFTFYSDRLNKIIQQIDNYALEKTTLFEDLHFKLDAQKALFHEEKRKSLADLQSNDMIKEIEERMKKSEQAFKEKQELLMKENDMQVSIISSQEEELLLMKTTLSVQHEKEKRALEEKFNLEAAELKARLAESVLEQNKMKVEQDRMKVEQERMKVEQERMKAETFQAEQQKTDTLKNLIASETEQYRLAEANRANDLKAQMLEKKLQEKEKTVKKVKKEMEDLEESMMCSICDELFTEPTVLNCGHTFCEKCITAWQQKNNSCPMCRTKMSSSSRNFALDVIIQKKVVLL